MNNNLNEVFFQDYSEEPRKKQLMMMKYTSEENARPRNQKNPRNPRNPPKSQKNPPKRQENPESKSHNKI
jgi:hypothetical protein